MTSGHFPGPPKPSRVLRAEAASIALRSTGSLVLARTPGDYGKPLPLLGLSFPTCILGRGVDAMIRDSLCFPCECGSLLCEGASQVPSPPSRALLPAGTSRTAGQTGPAWAAGMSHHGGQSPFPLPAL